MVAQLRARPGEWRLFPGMVAAPISVVERVRRRGHPALRLDDGKIHARMGMVAPSQDDRVITDVWLRFVPIPRKE